MRMNPNLSGSNQGKQAGVLQAFFLVAHLRDRQQGFTLLEVIIVMAILAIVAAIGVPSFSDWRERQAVQSVAQTLLSQMKQARVLAVAENRSVSISFTSTAYVFDADTSVSGTCGPCKNEQVNFSQYANNLSVSPTTTRTFTSRGTANSGTITLTAGSFIKKITMNVIGRAYLQ